MRRSTIGIGILGVLLFVLALWAMHWFYRVPPEESGAEGLRLKAEGIVESDLVSAGTMENGIPSIDAPEFESVGSADQYLKDDGEGLSVTVGKTRRFYPYQILVWHEIVNDTIGDAAVAVTYDPLCGTGMAFDRTVDGQARTFETSGFLWNNNLVMRDRETQTRWSQILGTDLEGGKTLRPLPATVMTWAAWREAYPRGEVLSRETGFSRDYTRDPYGNYARTLSVLFPLTHVDPRLPAKTRVLSLAVGTSRSAYPLDALVRMKTIRETVGDVPVELAYDEETESVSAFRLALDGESIEEIPLVLSYWFVVAAAFPDITLYELP